MSYQEVVFAQRYAREFRREICERLLAGEKVSKLSEESGVSPATLHRWKDQSTTTERGLGSQWRRIARDQVKREP